MDRQKMMVLDGFGMSGGVFVPTITSRIDGNITTPSYIAHTADFIQTYTIQILATSMNLAFKRVDASNLWVLYYLADGTIIIYEDIANTFTPLHSGNYGVVSGSRIALICVGDDLTIYVNEVKKYQNLSVVFTSNGLMGGAREFGGTGVFADLKHYVYSAQTAAYLGLSYP